MWEKCVENVKIWGGSICIDVPTPNSGDASPVPILVVHASVLQWHRVQCCDDFSCVCLTFLTAYLSTWHNMSMCRIAWRSCGTASSTSCSHCFRIRGCCSRPAHPSSRRPYSTTAPKFDFSARWSTVLCFYSYLFTELTLLCVVETESRWQGRVKDFSLGARSKSGGEVVGEGNNTNHQRYQVLKQSNTYVYDECHLFANRRVIDACHNLCAVLR